mmetsp:Transcript_77932/g.225425  ORF Transcript_77932/g.225425 Transcript_77932/m.225425 type:complete len:261 (+) Transcript_77932:259-1041(+)
MATRCHSNDTTGSPSTMTALQRRTHNVHISSTIKAIINTPGCELSGNVPLYWCFSQVLGVDKVSCTECLGHVKLLGVQVNGDDSRSTGMFGTLDDGQSYSSKAKDCNGRIGLHFARIPNSTKSSGDTTSEQAYFLKRRTWIDLGTRNLRQHSVFAHGRAAHEVIDILAIFIMESDCTIRHDTLSLGRSNFRAKVGLGRLTKDTRRLTALGCVAWDHMITRNYTCHTRPYRFDNTPSFVSKNTREQPLRIESIQCVDVGMT